MLCSSLLSPNQEVAFVVGAAYQSVAVLTNGVVVQIPSMSYPASYLHYISMLKYSCQAIFYLFFKDTPAEALLHMVDLDKPDTLWANILACVGFYTAFIAVGFLCLKYLYKEKR